MGKKKDKKPRVHDSEALPKGKAMERHRVNTEAQAPTRNIGTLDDGTTIDVRINNTTSDDVIAGLYDMTPLAGTINYSYDQKSFGPGVNTLSMDCGLGPYEYDYIACNRYLSVTQNDTLLDSFPFGVYRTQPQSDRNSHGYAEPKSKCDGVTNKKLAFTLSAVAYKGVLNPRINKKHDLKNVDDENFYCYWYSKAVRYDPTAKRGNPAYWVLNKSNGNYILRLQRISGYIVVFQGNNLASLNHIANLDNPDFTGWPATVAVS